ncbi:MAG TPA: penicillin acylase family protein [Thermoanaerobaculia bacterium]|nr:penicillin acylase family protein [Thermoanaerobaculia bacterium]
MRRALVVLGTLLFALSLFAAVGAVWLVKRNLPDDLAPAIPSLREAVRVTVDDRGVPTIAARSVDDALRVQGYLTARERLFQLELQRRAGEGRLAELLGKGALDLDRRRLTFGYARVAARAVPLLPDVERVHLQALSDGINAFLASHGGRLGLEFALLGERPRDFTPADALLVMLLMYEDLTTVWRDEVARDANRQLPPDVARFVFSSVSSDDVTIVPDGTPLRPPPLPELSAATEKGSAEAAAEHAEAAAGSNSFVVSGALTKSGKPILANDPHLTINMPALWLPMRFEIAGREVEGVTLPGLPGVVLGKNDAIAWGFTNLYTDVQDLYREKIVDGRAVRGDGSEGVELRIETIPVRGAAPERLEVRETSHGPLVTKELALKWTALDPRNLRLPTVEVMMAGTPADFDRALDGFFGPAQNVLWASAGGDIGWRATGLIPLRRTGTDGGLPYDGADEANDWKGFLPPSKLPRVVNPASGFLVTANNRVIGTGFPVPVSTHFWSSVRARRIRDLITTATRGGAKLDRRGVEAIQLDIVSEPMRRLMEAFGPYLPPDLSKLFSGWDGSADAPTPRFLIARALRNQLAERTLEVWKVRSAGMSLAEERVLDVALADRAAWRRAGLGEKAAAMKLVVEKALRSLAEAQGLDRSRWSWGERNRLNARHPLGLVPGLARVFDAPRLPMPGASGVPRVQNLGFGQSMRFIVDWGEPDAATLVVPFGVSGHVGSPHRMDQFPYWKDGDPAGAATRLARPPAGRPLLFVP